MRKPTGGSASAAVTAAEIAYCAGALDTWRHNWATQHRLKQKPPFTEHDAVETAIAHHLATVVSQKLAPKAWDLLRSQIQALIVSQSDIWIVLAKAGPRHSVVPDAAAAARHAAQLGECRILDMTEPIREARARYRELLEVARRRVGSGGASVRKLRSAGG
jgi:hypothetical protein